MLEELMCHIAVLEYRQEYAGAPTGFSVSILWSIVLLICSQWKCYARVKAVRGKYTIKRSAAVNFTVSMKHSEIQCEA